MYKQLININPDGSMGSLLPIVKRLSDNAFIPFDVTLPEYQQYLAWLAEGNEPLPAEQASPAEQPET